MLVTSSRKYGEGFAPIEVKTMSAVAKVATKKDMNWSCGVYEDNHRHLDNFLEANLIGLDIDNDGKEDETMSLEEAKEIFSEYVHLIITSRSHQKEKEGRITDRFRVVLKLSKPITTTDEFYATWQHLKNKWPAIDNKCKDPTRMWFCGGTVVTKSEQGHLIDPVEAMPKEEYEPLALDTSVRGKPSALTVDFIINGAPKDTRHDRLYKAARDLHEQGYGYDKAVEVLAPSAIKAYGYENPDIEKCIKSAFSKEPRHEKRTHFKFMTMSEIEAAPVTWIVEDLLAEGTTNIFAGKGGLGKSTFIRQMCKCICEGKPFLGRKTSKGSVLYIASEETKSIVKRQTAIQGLDKCPDFRMHIGGTQPMEYMEELEKEVERLDAKLLVIDSFSDAVEGADTNDQGAMVSCLMKWRTFADETNCSVAFIHHMNKGDRSKKKDASSSSIDDLMGSAMIVNKVDMVMTFTGNENASARWVSTPKMREGEKINKTRLDYNPVKFWYKADGGF